MMYKYYADMMTYMDAHQACWTDNGNAAAPYPSTAVSLFQHLLPAEDMWPAGVYRLSTSDYLSGLWVTFDGWF